MSGLLKLKQTLVLDPSNKEKQAMHEIITGILLEEVNILEEDLRSNLLVYGKETEETVGIYFASTVERVFSKTKERIDA